MAEKKRCVVFVVSVCEILLRFGPCRDVEKNADKRSDAWPRRKLIFAVFLFFFIHLLFAAAHCFRSDSDCITNTQKKL